MLDNEVMVRFALTKADGNFRPKRSEISEFEAQDFRHWITLNICWEPFVISDQHPNLQIVALEILYDGCTRIDGERFGLYIDSNGVSGYPAPIIRFQTNKPVTGAAFTLAIRDTYIGITTNSRERAGDLPFFAEDHNGYSEVIERSQQKE